MKWFKHMSDMSADVKIKRLVRKYGVEGYGLYNYILELIVRKLETESPLPDLEESSQDIAGDLKMDTIRVEEIMLFCIQQGLFEQDEVTGRIVAAKVYKFLAQSETRSEEMRRMIKAYKSKETPIPPSFRLSETVTDKSEEQNRTEQNRKICVSTDDSSFATSSQKKPGPPASDDAKAFGAYWESRSRLAGPIEYPLEFERFWESYPRPVDKKGTLRKWARTLKKGAATVDELHRAAMGYRKQKVDHEGTNRQYLKHSTTFLGDTEPWRDYLTPDVPVHEAGRVCPQCGVVSYSTESFCLECGADFE